MLHMPLSEQNAVWIEHYHGRWIVFVYVKGQTTQHPFETKDCATNFAERQRLLLFRGNEVV